MWAAGCLARGSISKGPVAAEGWQGAQEVGEWAAGCQAHHAPCSMFWVEHKEKVLGLGSPCWMRPCFPSSNGTRTPGSHGSRTSGLEQGA